MAGEKVVSVLVPVAVAAPYTYRAPDDTRPGDIVVVPLGTRDTIGVVWDDPPDPEIGHNRLRPIVRRYDTPPLSKDIRAFVDWVADYTLTSRGMVLRMILRSPGALEPEAPVAAVVHAGPPPERMTPARARVMAVVQAAGSGPRVSPEASPRTGSAATGNQRNNAPVWTRASLAAAAGVSTGVVQGLIDAGTLAVVTTPAPPPAAPPDPDHGAPQLSPEQAAAAAHLRGAVDAGGYSVTLLDGVTGSGKTEVYFEAVAEAVRRKRQVLILVPEIALTAEFLERFARRFGVKPAEWHSEVPPRLRERVWRGIADGSVQVVVGARSALYLPYANLGLIVVDEEHDLAYKQEEGAVYNARDMAVVRAHLAGFPVVLASATPSIESRVNADAGRYTRIELPSRYMEAALPTVGAIDLRKQQPERGRFLAPPLVGAMNETLAAGQQSLLFLNRRGYAPLTLCRTCGHRFQCPNCSTWLVEHRFRGVLLCHHCGHSEPRPKTCPACGNAETLTPVGPGIERLHEEVTARFPDARTVALSSDLLGGVQRMREELAGIARGNCDIVIGTQLVAKGHNFPLLTLVGVVDADLGLAHGDHRAAERTFQLLSQVTGRAGRMGGASRALLQTWAPEHPVIQAIVAGDREAFYAREIAARREAELPPFGRLAAVIVSGYEKGPTLSFAAAVRRAAPQDPAVEVLGPAEAPLAVVRGRHRYRLLAQSPRNTNLQAYLRAWLAAAPRPRGDLKVQVDVDPQSFL